jgi:hypothetical protein
MPPDTMGRSHEDDTDSQNDNGAHDAKRIKNKKDAPSKPDFIVLDVGGRKFHTLKSTLKAFSWFDARIDWDDNKNREAFFIDANPDTFAHILDFMRRGSKFPLFWSKSSGFNVELYNELEIDADYFGLDDLRDWIRAGKFQDALVTSDVIVKSKLLWTAIAPDQKDSIEGTNAEIISSTIIDTEADYKRWVCAMYPDHRGSEDCDCDFEDGIRGEWDVAKKEIILLLRETRIDMRACVNGLDVAEGNSNPTHNRFNI